MRRLLFSTVVLSLLLSASTLAQSDRSGIRTSMLETYVEPGQFLIFPFYAYSWDHNYEYQPSMFGIGVDQDFEGTYRTNEVQLFLAYGVTDWLAVELEGARIIADFTRDPSDGSGTPSSLQERGTADVAGQVRLRLAPERGRRPEFFAAVELLPPQHSSSVLIGDGQWDVKGEIGATRGYHWGTMTFRTTIEYNRGDTHWDLGETSLEWLKRLSPSWRVLAAIEGGEGGAPDDWVLRSAVRWRVARGIDLKFANGLGLFPKSTDWEAQLGVLMTLQ